MSSRPLIRIWQLGRRVFAEYGKDNGPLMAAAVAFYGLLSLVPLLLVGVWAVATWVGDSQRAQVQVFSVLDAWMPVERQSLRAAVSEALAQRGAIGLTGLAGLMLTSIGGFATLETAVNFIWNTKRRNMLMNKIFALGMLLLLGVLMLASIAMTALLQWAGSIPGLQWVSLAQSAALLTPLLSITLSTVMFTLVYKWFPNTRVHWRPTFFAALTTAVVWEATKTLYAAYTARFSDFGSAYGAMGGLIGLILWIYYSSALVLLGAELAWVLGGEEEERLAAIAAEPVAPTVPGPT